MKKTFAARLTAVLLTLTLCVSLTLPAFAAEQPIPEPTWQTVIESVTPIGEPWVALDLMPNGYIFTDYSIPREYDVALGVENGSAALKLDMNRMVALAFRMTGYFERLPLADA